MRYLITVGSPLFCEKGPRQGTTEVKFSGSVFLEPEELEAYFHFGLVVRIGTDSEPFNTEEQSVESSDQVPD